MSGSSSSFRSPTLGRYQIRGELGRGAFGSVFRAFDPKLNRDVAIKLLVRDDARSAARFAREIQAAAKLRHPNIVAVHESGDYRGRPYLVMEFVDGDDLEALAQGDRPLSISRAAEIVRDAARAIQHAHEQEVLHRDVKPQNILVDRAGQAHVVDFGLASLRDSHLERLSHTGLPLGTPAYMAPEQMRGETVDERADVFGLGGTLYYALCRQPPRGEGVSPFASAVANRIEPPSQIDPRVPRALDAVCLEALREDPWARYDSAGALGDALDRFLAGESPSGRSRGRAFVIPLLVAAVAILGGLLALLASRAPDPTPTPTVATTPDAPPPASPELALVAASQEHLERARELARTFAPAASIEEALRAAEDAAAGAPTQLERVQLAFLRHLFDRGRHSRVLARAVALRDRPGATGHEAQLLQANTLLRLKRKEEGLQAAEALARADPGGVFGACARSLLAGFRDSDQAQVARIAQGVLDRDPDNHYALLQRALALANSGRAKESLSLYRQFGRSERRDDVYGHLAWAIALISARRRPADPTDELDRVIRSAFALLAPEILAVALRTRGHALLFTGRTREAVPDLKRGHELDPQDAVTPFLLGMAHDKLEQHGPARTAYRKAYATDAPQILEILSTIEPLALRSRIRRDLGRPARVPQPNAATRAYKARRIKRVSPPAQPQVTRALQLMEEGHPWSTIEPAFAAARAAAPDDGNLAWIEAEAVLGRGDAEEAGRQIYRARRLGAQGLELDFLEAEVCWRGREQARGRRLFLKVARADPRGVLGRCALAHMEWQAGKDERATKALLALTREHPTHVPSWILLSVLLRNQDQFEAAVTATQRARVLVGFLDPWVMGQEAVCLLALAVREKQAPPTVSRALQGLDNALAASDEPTLRLLGANYACEYAARGGESVWLSSVARWLHELRRDRPKSPEPHLLAGWFDLSRGRPAEVVLSAWRDARKAGAAEVPTPLSEAFRRRFGRAPSD